MVLRYPQGKQSEFNGQGYLSSNHVLKLTRAAFLVSEVQRLTSGPGSLDKGSGMTIDLM